MAKLGEYASFIMGQAPESSECNTDGTGTPFVKAGQFGESSPEVNEWTTNPLKMAEKNDVLICVVGATSGKLNRGIDCAIGRSVAAIRPNENVNRDYIYYGLHPWIMRLRNNSQGSAIGVITKDMLDTIEMPFPNINEQNEIVTTLQIAEQIIRERRKELKLLDELIQARFIEMFGDAVANPMHWPVKRLKELSVQINSGNTPKGGSENYVKKGITFFRSQNVWKDHLEMDDIAYIDVEMHASMKRSSLKHGDILMTKTGRINTENSSLGRAALYDGEDDMANVNGHVYFIRLKEGVNNKFVLRILVSPEYRDLIRSVCVGGIDKRQLNKEHIEEFPIICPASDMIDDYVAFVNQVNKLKVT